MAGRGHRSTNRTYISGFTYLEENLGTAIANTTYAGVAGWSNRLYYDGAFWDSVHPASQSHTRFHLVGEAHKSYSICRWCTQQQTRLDQQSLDSLAVALTPKLQICLINAPVGCRSLPKAAALAYALTWWSSRNAWSVGMCTQACCWPRMRLGPS